MTTIRTILGRATAATVIVAAAPSLALAHAGEGGPLGFLHDFLHGTLFDPGHALRPLGSPLMLLGAAVLFGASRAAGPSRRQPLRAVGSATALAGLLTLV